MTESDTWARPLTPENFLEDLLETRGALAGLTNPCARDIAFLAEVEGRIADLKRQVGVH